MNLFPPQLPPTILAGAGLSAPAPTCLPGWWALNDEVLQALGDAVERATGRNGLSADFRAVVTQRRDSTPFLKPDLQAQLIEDQIGEAYFRALANVDSTAVNSSHELIADLARQGRVGAILTTNFDCTIEKALDAAGVGYSIFAAPEEFENLANHSAGLALVKIHGTASRPETMVDTLRQRLHGRPKALNQWMRARFLRFPTIAIGFSGEDLEYDPDYLSIRPSVIEGATFRFLVREKRPSVPLEKLRKQFPKQVRLLRGELPAWLFEAVQADRIDHSVPIPIRYSEEQVNEYRSRAQERLKKGLNQWSVSLTRMEAINAVTALLSSAGQRPRADKLLERTWNFFREAADCSGPAYGRYLYNYGETLMRGARFLNPYERKTDPSAWKEAADLDPGQFFFRATQYGGPEAAQARLALCKFLAGSPISALVPSLELTVEGLSHQAANGSTLSLTLIDASFSLVELIELCAWGKAGAGILESSYQSAGLLGDEFRRAESAWRLARNLSFGLTADPASAERVTKLAEECSVIAARLNIRESDAGSALARSIAAQARGDWDASAFEAERAEEARAELGDLLGVCFAKRERVRALIGRALKSGRANGSDFDLLSEWLQTFAKDYAPGMRPIIKLELALLAVYFDQELASQLATDAAEVADLQEHPYIGNKAREVLRSLEPSP